MSAPVRHLLHTNVAGSGGGRFRVRMVPSVWTHGDAERISEWLAELGRRRVSAEVTGWASACFRIGRELWSAVACVPAGWQHDDFGRGGAVLVHGVFTHMSEHSEAGAAVHALPLIEVVSQLAVRPGDGLQAYVDACERMLEAPSAAPDPVSVVTGVEPAEVAAFLSQAARGTVAYDAVPSDAQAVARAAASLPPRLRAAVRWCVGLLPVDPVGLARVESPAAAPPGAAQRYNAWLRDAIDSGRLDEVGYVLRDWDRARSWQTLIQWLYPNLASR